MIDFNNDISTFFRDFGQEITYNDTYTTKAIMTEALIDDEISDGIVAKKTEVLIPASFFEEWSIEPKIHDTINGTLEVIERIDMLGIYKLVCIEKVRPKP